MNELFGNQSPPPKRASQAKKRPVFDYVRETWFEGRDVPCERKRIGLLARNFAQLCGDVTPKQAVEEITRRRDVYRRMWPRVAETPEALFKNWSQMAQRVAAIQANQGAKSRADLRDAEKRLQELKGVISNSCSPAQRQGAEQAFATYVPTLGAMVNDPAISAIITDIRIML